MSAITKSCESCRKSFVIPFACQSHLRFCSSSCWSEWTKDKKQVEKRFWAKVNKDGPIPEYRPELGPCWIWTGAISHGYGNFWDGHGYIGAHAFSYELSRGEIPNGLEPDHLCRVRACVRDTHLEAVTHRENTIRGMTPNTVTYRTGVCRKGHSGNFIVRINGRKRCRDCYLDWYIRTHPHKPPKTPKTHCMYGHPLSSGNVYLSKDGRHCKICVIGRINARRLGMSYKSYLEVRAPREQR